MVSKSTDELLSAMHGKLYRKLKNQDFDLYVDCVRAAESVTLTHDLSPKAARDCEWAVIGMVCQAIGIKP